VTVRLVDEAGIPLDVNTPLNGQYGMTLEDWADFYGVPDHVWSNIRQVSLDVRVEAIPSLGGRFGLAKLTM
jgi:hypothetical protein